MFYSRISGWGYYLPKKILTNADLEKMVKTSDDWIYKRTGIRSRHVAEDNELPSDMGCKASLKALEQAQLQVQDIELILVATLYPDQLMPNTACILQKKLQIKKNIPALDISAACSGFVYALSIANQFIQTGTYKHILVVGTEALHHILDYQDRSSCILFGDGAGACVVSQNNNPEHGCVYHQQLKAYGELGHLLTIPSPGAMSPPYNKEIPKKDQCIQLVDGPKIFKTAVEMMCDLYQQTLKEMSQHTVDWIVAHQANERILRQFCQLSHYPVEKMIFDIETTGNTSAASIPISMSRAIENNRIKRGQNILLLGMGGGFTSGSIFLRY